MKKNEDFFEKNQTPLTKAKIMVYEKYITAYLPKLLIQFGTCLIADLFSGAGRSGKDKGSPLILIEKIEYILTSPKIQEEKKRVIVMFNDSDEKNIIKLKKELDNISYNEQIEIAIDNINFKDFLSEFLNLCEYENFNNKIPKFIFLDPYGYSNIKMKDLKELVDLNYTEVLLFLPIFHSYRFAKDEKLKDKENHKTKIFLDEFTTKGVFNYKDIYDFMESIKDKLKKELDLKYVRPLLLDAGSNKNSLFLLTKHREGMLLMNKIANKSTDNQNKNKINVKKSKENALFGEKEIRTEDTIFKEKLITFLKKEKHTNNDDIIEFTIQEGFLPKHAKKILQTLYKKNQISVLNQEKEELKSNKWNIKEKPDKIAHFYWREQ